MLRRSCRKVLKGGFIWGFMEDRVYHVDCLGVLYEMKGSYEEIDNSENHRKDLASNDSLDCLLGVSY